MGLHRAWIVGLTAVLLSCHPTSATSMEPAAGEPSRPPAAETLVDSTVPATPEGPATPTGPIRPYVHDEDGDGIPTDADACPDRPELLNDVEDGDGCPDVGAFGIRLSNDDTQLLGDERLRFEFNSDVVHPNSQPLLDALTDVVLRNEHLGPLRIEGHSDNVGTREYNLALTQRRADAIRAHFERAGVPPQRLRAVGFGEDRMISHCPDRDRRCNRRIEFHFESREPDADEP